MFKVEFYNDFSKKPNSTRIPTANESVVAYKFDCVMKEPSSMITPVISLDLRMYEDDEYMTTITPAHWNYAYIAVFRRYYFIDDIVCNHGLYDFYLRCDTLASFRDEIEEETAYIIRSQRRRDQFISDAIFPSKIDTMQSEIEFDNDNSEMVLNDGDGAYIVGVINPDSMLTAVSYYALTYQQFAGLKQALFSISNYRSNNSPLEISDDLLKVLYNPFQYISSVMYVPFAATSITDEESTQIPFGWWDGNIGITAYGRPISRATSLLLYCGQIDFNRHPDAGNFDIVDEDGLSIPPYDGRGQFLNYAPYSEYYVRFEPFGFFELDNQIMGDLLSKYTEGYVILDFYIKLDLITGRAYLQIMPELEDFEISPLTFTPMEAQLGIPLQLGQITADTASESYHVSRTVAGTTTNFINAIASGNILGAIGGAVNGAVDIASSIYDGKKIGAPKMVTSGANGSFGAFNQLQYGYVRYSVMCENDPEETGFPLMKKLQIKKCKPGFVQCGFTDIKIPGATENERTEIINFLIKGIYLEDDAT